MIYQVHLFISSDSIAIDINPKAKENCGSAALQNFFLWRNSPNRTQAASLLRFIDHTQAHTRARAVGLL
jgi:hypothetical protein